MKDNILIIDDSPELAELLELHLKSDFDVTIAHSGSEGIEAYQERDYAVTLLDIEMPGLNGFQVFEQLKQIERKNHSAVIFFSGHDNEENVLKCFDLGGDDFVSKMTEVPVLAQKVRALVRYKKLINNLHNEEEKLNSLIDTTMMQASFYGSCVSLMSDIQLAPTEDALAQLIFNFMQQQGLSTAISFTHQGEEILIDQQKRFCSPIEKQVFGLLRDKGRIYEFGRRMMLNDVHVSVLIKEMPDKESTQYGLLIDVLAKLVPAIEMRYRALINNKQLEKAQLVLQNSVQDIQTAIVELQADKQKLIDNIVMQIGLSFHDMDFSEDQEQFLINLIEKSVVEQANNNEKFISINSELESTIDLLTNEENAPQFQQDEDAASSDIELF